MRNSTILLDSAEQTFFFIASRMRGFHVHPFHRLSQASVKKHRVAEKRHLYIRLRRPNPEPIAGKHHHIWLCMPGIAILVADDTESRGPPRANVAIT
jgi:hypothetical protein